MKAPIALGFRTWLLLAAIVSACPLLVLSLLTITHLREARYQSVLTALQERTQSTGNALNLRLDIAVGVLKVLASSDAALQGDYRALHRHASQVVPQTPGVMAITLVREDGSQIFSTLLPYGAVLPPTGSSASVARIFASGQPATSGLYTGSTTGQRIVAIGVPVRLDDTVTACLRMIVSAEVFTRVLDGMHVPAEWVVALVDDSQHLIAITHLAGRGSGDDVPDALRPLLQRGVRGLISFLADDGVEITAEIAPVPNSDWVVVIGVPTQRLKGPANETTRIMVIWTALVFTLGALLAVIFSELLTRQLRLLQRASGLVMAGLPQVASGSKVREIVELGETLNEACLREQKIRSALADAITTQHVLSGQLNSARCDTLTGLAGRGLFLELAEIRRAETALAVVPHALAMMLIDLDGFKAVNDRFGHARGDEILCQTADILRHILRESDLCGRLGGDEFVVCISAVADDIASVAEMIAGRIVSQIGQMGDGVGCSVGVAICPPTCSDISCVLQFADRAMYRAKNGGKNRYVVVDCQDDSEQPAA